MIKKLDKFCGLAALFSLIALFLPIGGEEILISWGEVGNSYIILILTLVVAAAFCFYGVRETKHGVLLIALSIAASSGAYDLFDNPEIVGETRSGFWMFIFAIWALVWRGIDKIAAFKSLDKVKQSAANFVVPVAFGVWLIFLWELIVIGMGVPQVLLPSPGAIGIRLVGSVDILWADFVQTFMKAVITGFTLGCGSAFIVALLVDRIPFLKRGLLPLGNMVSALPIIGVAPIMVMWFGFDWQSKVAVVVIMTFFPMLVNTVTGLAATSQLEKDLMSTYASSHWQTLIFMRLPVAMPFIFNALKINSTLALIGAIVAEFFGTPIVGMGFRISTEVGRMNVDMVWAEIVVAALAGSAFYGITALIERSVTFWHPSYRQRR